MPIRLVPNRRQQATTLGVFVVVFGLALFWMVSDAGLLDQTKEGYADYPGLEPDWREQLHPLMGLPFVLLGLCGIVVSVVRMRPNSPLYHLQVSPSGVVNRTLRKHQVLSWAQLPELVTDRLQWLSLKTGRTNTIHFVVGRGTAAGEGGVPRQKDLLRIVVDEYAAEGTEQSAQELATWLNGLRAQSLAGALQTGAEIEVPAAFRAVPCMSGGSSAVQRS